MKIFVKAKTLAKEEKIKKNNENHFIIWIKEPPIKGKANEVIMRKLAEYFQVPVSQVIFKSGFSSRDKMFEIKL